MDRTIQRNLSTTVKEQDMHSWSQLEGAPSY